MRGRLMLTQMKLDISTFVKFFQIFPPVAVKILPVQCGDLVEHVGINRIRQSVIWECVQLAVG